MFPIKDLFPGYITLSRLHNSLHSIENKQTKKRVKKKHLENGIND